MLSPVGGERGKHKSRVGAAAGSRGLLDQGGDEGGVREGEREGEKLEVDGESGDSDMELDESEGMREERGGQREGEGAVRVKREGGSVGGGERAARPPSSFAAAAAAAPSPPEAAAVPTTGPVAEVCSVLAGSVNAGEAEALLGAANGDVALAINYFYDGRLPRLMRRFRAKKGGGEEGGSRCVCVRASDLYCVCLCVCVRSCWELVNAMQCTALP